MPDIFKNLNEPQRQAAEHIDGPLLILAGAGTGKTRVLTTRVANILQSNKAFPNQIMAVTFTNKAAKEISNRVEALIGMPTVGMWLGTFHSIGARILRKHAERVGLKPDFTILDTDDQKRLIKQILKDKNIDSSKNPPRLLLHIIASWKDKGWQPKEVPQEEQHSFNSQGIALYFEYQKRLEALNAADFGDLLLKGLLILLRDHKDVLEFYQKAFKYVLVDEYQDTNNVQYLWLRLLVMSHHNICVVGDDDQSIYGWRGAQVGNILKFEKDFPNTTTIRLEQNYRSTGNILKAASALIAKNEERHAKTLWTQMDDGNPIEVHALMDGKEEARMVCDHCERGASEERPYTDYAILVRSSAQTRAFEEQFVKAHVPYIIVGGLKFYERKEIRDAIAYLKLIANEANDLAFQRIVNVPRRGVGNVALNTLNMRVKQHNLSLFSATKQCLEQNELSGKAAKTLQGFVDLIIHNQTQKELETPDRLMENVLENSGYLEMLQNDKKDPNAKTRLDNLKELVRALQDYPDITSFLEHVSLVMDEETSTEDAVRLMTVHAAKGLEFKTVFLPGFEDGLFPHQRSLNEDGQKGLEEERRLAYVAMTRARKNLIISYTSSRMMYGQLQPSFASCFLKDIPKNCIKEITSTSSHLAFRPRLGSRMDTRSAGDYAKPSTPLISYEKIKNTSNYPIGSRVFHLKFGYGHIHKTQGSGAQTRLIINFEKAGQKTLVASIANLEKVN